MRYGGNTLLTAGGLALGYSIFDLNGAQASHLAALTTDSDQLLEAQFERSRCVGEGSRCSRRWLGTGGLLHRQNLLRSKPGSNQCTLARCGDGFLRQDKSAGEIGYEACDDGNDDNRDACTNDCRLAACGDGELRPWGKVRSVRMGTGPMRTIV